MNASVSTNALSLDTMRLLDHINVPEGLEVQITHDAGGFMNRKVTLNKASHQWFGSAFLQGNRIQFTTSMTLGDYLAIANIENRGKKGFTVSELRNAGNRPAVTSHQKDIKDYLMQTACVGEKFIFPNFVLTFGIGWTDQHPKGRLTLLVTDPESLAWAAIFEPPMGKQLPVTDGAHRTASIHEMLKGKNRAGIDALLGNAVGVTIVMEENQDASHQDFADCAKAKPISDSVKNTYDVRDVVGKFTRDLVESNVFLKALVDATSPSVNLSSNSKQAWSMSAVRGYILHAFPGYDTMSDADKKVAFSDIQPLSDYVDACAKNILILSELAENATDPKKGVSAGEYRKQRGGCVLLRGAGWGLLMHARAQAILNGMDPLDMAKALSGIDWFLLKPTHATEPTEISEIFDWLKEAAQPAWHRMVAFNIESGSYRIKGSRTNISTAFDELKSELLAA